MRHLLICVVNLITSTVLVTTVHSLRALGRPRGAELSGTWYGTDEPPEGFKGYWFDGRVHQVYPIDVKVSHLTAEEIADLEED